MQLEEFIVEVLFHVVCAANTFKGLQKLISGAKHLVFEEGDPEDQGWLAHAQLGVYVLFEYFNEVGIDLYEIGSFSKARLFLDMF